MGAFFAKIVLPVLVVAGGAMAMMALISMKKDPPKRPPEIHGVLVKTIMPETGSQAINVTAFGEVVPTQEIDLSPQVGGRVEWVNDSLQSGAFCGKGDVLFRIEKRDYEIMVEQAKAGVSRAEHELVVIRAQASMAKQEWDRLVAAQESLPEEMRVKIQAPDPLALFEPQLKNAEAALKSAQVAQERADLDLARCEVACPFNARVRSEMLDVGQIIRPGDKIAKLFATDAVDILLRVPLDKLRFLKLPTEQGVGGSAGKALLRWGRQNAVWDCRLVRSLGEVERSGRMVGLIARVENPFASEAGQERPQLRLNDYVEVELNGIELQESLVIPSEALRENSTVWIYDNGALAFKEVVVDYQTDRKVFLASGLEGKDEVVLGAVPSAVMGMKLRKIGEKSAGDEKDIGKPGAKTEKTDNTGK